MKIQNDDDDESNLAQDESYDNGDSNIDDDANDTSNQARDESNNSEDSNIDNVENIESKNNEGMKAYVIFTTLF